MTESGAPANSKTYNAQVVVLEDHDDTVNCICKRLIEDGKVVAVAKTLDRFEELVIETGKFDAYSMDWRIDDTQVGASALSFLRAHDREAGKLVYSVYVDAIKHKAYSGGADFVLQKVGENYDEYRVEVEKTAKLGISRRINRRLDELGHPLGVLFTPGGEVEDALYIQSRQLARKKLLASEHDELIDLLKRRGWWIPFDISSYSNLPAWEKLASLFEYVGAEAGDVARILECDPADARKLLKSRKVGREFAKRADEMLSILAYLLRLSDYDPELMPHYWKVTDLFGGSLSSPPWDASGLYAYLSSAGVAGIEEALYWIRSH